MTDDYERTKKQSYLREKIIDVGYDPQAFVEYLQVSREEGEDIDNWSLEDLKDIVEHYIANNPLNSKGAEEQEKEKPVVPSVVTVQPAITTDSYAKSSQEIPKFAIMENTFEEIKVATLTPGEFADKPLKAKITNTAIDKGGVFSSAVVEFLIETEPTNWRVLRKFEDGIWLREQLQRFFPVTLLPPLNKKEPKEKTNVAGINKRLYWLQRFLDELMRNKIFRSVDIVIKFLSISDKGQFEKMKKLVSKSNGPRIFTEIKHLESQAAVDVKPEKVALGKNLVAFCNSAQELFERALRANENTVRALQSLMIAFEYEAEAYKDLTSAYASIESAEFADIFNSMRQMMEGQVNLAKNQSSIFNEHLGKYYNYYREQMAILKQASSNMLVKYQEYKKKETRLYARKEKLYMEGNVKAWELSQEMLTSYTPKQISEDRKLAMRLILPKDTRDLENTHVEYGYYLNKLIEEHMRVSYQDYRKTRKHFKKLSDEQTKQLEEMAKQWNYTSQRLNEKITKWSPSQREALVSRVKTEIAACKPRNLNPLALSKK